jgi:hypothetical protein
VPAKWDGAFPFSGGLAAVNKGGRVKRVPAPRIEGGKWGYVDREGNVVIPPRYDFPGKFTEGLAPVNVGGLAGGKWGYIDNTGRTAIEPRFDEAAEFLDGLARVKVGGKPGYIDRKGNFVWPAGD